MNTKLNKMRKYIEKDISQVTDHDKSPEYGNSYLLTSRCVVPSVLVVCPGQDSIYTLIFVFTCKNKYDF